MYIVVRIMVLHNVPTLPNASPLLTEYPSTKTSKPVSFYIKALDYDVGINLLGNLTTTPNDLPQCDAECVFNVQVGLLQSVFKLWLDDMSIDFTDASSNARYYVFTKNWTNMDMNIANALVIDGAIAAVSNKQLMLTKQDFLRYLAKNLFGTHLGTDLFSNEQGLLNDIGVQAHNAWTTQMNILNKVAATADTIISVSDPSYTTTLQTYPYLHTDATGKKYLTNADTTPNNITYQLMSIINQVDPGRLASDFATQTIGSDGLASVPFRAGDSLFFYTNLAPAQGQELLTGVPTIPTRKYALKINIISNDATPANPIPLEYNSTLVKKYAEYCLGKSAEIDENVYVIYNNGSKATLLNFNSFTDVGNIKTLTYNGVIKTNFGDNFFNNFSSLTTLVGFNSTIYIGHGCFSGCANLTTIPAFGSLTNTGNNIFYNCQKLTQIGDTNNPAFISLVSLGGSSFFNCNHVTSINGFNSLIEVTANAFMFCSALTTITGFDNVTTVDSQAFAYCSSLSKPSFIKPTTIITSGAFLNCPFTI